MQNYYAALAKGHAEPIAMPKGRIEQLIERLLAS